MADLLSIGKTGLAVSKKSLETTAHNIANVNTEGYSRQRVNQQTNSPIAKGGLIQGTGAKIRSIERNHDPYVEKRLRASTSNQSYYEHRANQMTRVENIFNEVDNDGLNKVINKFYNAFRELANQPENQTIRSVVRDTSKLVVKDFQRIRGTLDTIARSIDQKMDGEITDINTTMRSLANLNKKIQALEAAGDETGDLRDQRDLNIKELSKSFKIHTYIDGKGGYNVNAVNVGTLVSGTQFQELATRPITKTDSTNNMDGSVEIYFKERPNQPITHRFKSGTLSALAKVRNEDLKALQEETDNIAFEFANTVNAIHRKGFANRKVDIDANGKPMSSDITGKTTGINFFNVPIQREGAALQLSLSNEVKDDINNIVTGFAPNSPGDNRIAIAISKLQHEKVMADGSATIEEKYLQTIGNIGLETGKARLDSEQAEGILVQVQALKERYSGVSIDEETANMIRYQHAFEASAKVMQSANEMFATVLSIKR